MATFHSASTVPVRQTASFKTENAHPVAGSRICGTETVQTPASSAFLWPKSGVAVDSRPRMGGVIDFLHPLGGYVGVNLGGREAGVAEQALHAAQVGAGIEEVGGEAVTEFVRADF